MSDSERTADTRTNCVDSQTSGSSLVRATIDKLQQSVNNTGLPKSFSPPISSAPIQDIDTAQTYNSALPTADSQKTPKQTQQSPLQGLPINRVKFIIDELKTHLSLELATQTAQQTSHITSQITQQNKKIDAFIRDQSEITNNFKQ